jgi:hypothetical protein
MLLESSTNFDVMGLRQYLFVFVITSENRMVELKGTNHSYNSQFLGIPGLPHENTPINQLFFLSLAI